MVLSQPSAVVVEIRSANVAHCSTIYCCFATFALLGDTNLRVNSISGTLAGGVGRIQNRSDNSDVISAIKDLKEGLNNNTTSYTINGITYDDGSNVSSAIETLVRAARIERRI